MAETDWKYLQYNIETGQKRTGDGPSGGPSSLADLDDTSISNPSDGEMLGYDETEGKWKNVSAPGGNVDDVEVNGVSVVNAQKVAKITSYKEVTQAQYEALPDTKLSDNILYAIKDGGQAVDGFPPLIYSDEEREIGVWRDGKPLYQKNFHFSTPQQLPKYGTPGFKVGTVSNIETIVGFSGISTTYNEQRLTTSFSIWLENTNDIYLSLQTGHANPTIYLNDLTLQYTKTTDTPGSGTWTTQGAIAHHYSTDEHIIGTWIDGKPLYERSFTKILANSPDADSSSFLVASNVTGIETLVKIEGTIKAASAYAFAPVCGLPVQIGWNYAFHINPTNQLVVWTSNAYANYSNIAGGTAICTLQYTKTTD